MARTKKTDTEAKIVLQLDPILPLSVDYSNEGLNNIARKINELIDRING